MINLRMIAKWSAKLTGLATSAIFTIYLIIGWINGAYDEVDSVYYLFLLFMILAIVGYTLAWYRPLQGAVIMIVGGALMSLFHFTQDDRFTAMVYGIPFIIEGCLFLLSQQGVKQTIVVNSAKAIIIIEK